MWYFTIVCLVAQSLWLFLTPWTVACQAPLPMEFPRQEYWGGLPIAYSRGSSQSRDWNWVSCTGRWILYHCTSWEAHFTMTKPVLLCCAYWLSLTLRPMDYSPQAPLSMGVLQARILEWVAMPSSRESSQPQGEPKFLVSQADSLLLEPPGEPKNTGVVSLYWSG